MPIWCGRRAFSGRFILRCFGIPTLARPQPGHATLVHWTPKGWVICLGAGWGWGRVENRPDTDFLAMTQVLAEIGHATMMDLCWQLVGLTLKEFEHQRQLFFGQYRLISQDSPPSPFNATSQTPVLCQSCFEVHVAQAASR